MKLNNEQLKKIIIGFVLSITVVVLLMAFVFSPSLKKSHENRLRIRKEQDKVRNAELDVKSLPEIKLNLQKFEEQIAQYKLNMPQATPDWLLGKLNSIAGETGVNFDKMEHRGSISRIGDYSLQELYIELRTDYHTLGKFINKIENSSPFLKIVDLSIAKNKDDVSNHLVKLMVGAYVSE